MKTPTLIHSISRDLDEGHSAVIQIVSTGEALMERRLADLPTEEWNDVRMDITPRRYVLSYLGRAFRCSSTSPSRTARATCHHGPSPGWSSLSKAARLSRAATS